MHSNDILNLLLETSRVEFKIAFPIRLQEKIKNEIKEKWYPMNVFRRPFEMGYKDNERSDGVVLSRTYFRLLNTILGELFVHNLLTEGYDWVHSDLYNLPPSVQILYRRFILHHNYPSIQLNLDTIVENMNFTEKNRSDLIECIETNSLELYTACPTNLHSDSMMEVKDYELKASIEKTLNKKNKGTVDPFLRKISSKKKEGR